MAAGRAWGRPPPDALRVGAVLPAGPAGLEAERGARLGAEEAGQAARLFGRTFELLAERADGAAEVGRAARRLAGEGVYGLVGGLDEASCAALAAAAERHGLLFLNIGYAGPARADERCRRVALHVEASAAMYVDALAEWLAREQGLGRWFLVTAASGPGAALRVRAERALRARGAEAVGGAEADDEADAAPPAVRWLQEAERAGAEVLFAGLAGPPLAALLAEYRARGPRLEVAGPYFDPGAASPPAVGTWPALWHHELERYGAAQLNQRFRERFGAPLGPRGWAAWLAVKILWEAAARARTTAAPALVRHLEKETTFFDGHKGRPLSFRPWDHQLRQPLYLLRPRSAPRAPEEAWEVAAELPRRPPGEPRSSRELLDRLGDLEPDSPCRLEAAASP